MTQGLRRRYGTGNLHFITCSCYQRLPLLGTSRARNLFVKTLGEVRQQYQFALVGYAVMPEHIHLLISEPKKGTPAVVMQVLKQRVSRALRQRRSLIASVAPESNPRRMVDFWQRRFYDFNVWSRKKKVEKLAYMHMNPVKRGLVTQPIDWAWSSYAWYEGRTGAIAIDWVE